MREFKITEQQVQQIAGVLLELPAKNVLSSLDILRNLTVIEEFHENKPD